MSRTLVLSLRAGLLAYSCVLAACQELPELQYETEHLRIGTRFEESLCRGDLDRLEALVTDLEVQLDASVERPIEVYVWSDIDADPPDWCDGNLEGCYVEADRAIYTSERSIGHELVHAVVDTFADPAPFWSEGAADALEFTRTQYSSSPPSETVESDAPNYSTASHFARWLINSYGIESYRALLRQGGSAREAFASTYGLSIEEAEASYFDEAPASYGALNACGHPSLPSTGEGVWSESFEIDCASPHVYGGSLSMLIKRELVISEHGHYAVSTTADGGLLSRCQDEDYLIAPTLDEPELYGDVPAYTEAVLDGYLVPLPGNEEARVLELAPGRYELAVGYLSYETQTAEVEVARVPDPAP